MTEDQKSIILMVPHTEALTQAANGFGNSDDVFAHYQISLLDFADGGV